MFSYAVKPEYEIEQKNIKLNGYSAIKKYIDISKISLNRIISNDNPANTTLLHT